MDIGRDELDRIVNEHISRRFNNIGIYDDSPERVEASRANSVLINSIRVAREEGQGAFKRLFADAMGNFGGQAIWVVIAAGCVWAWQAFKVKVSGP